MDDLERRLNRRRADLSKLRRSMTAAQRQQWAAYTWPPLTLHTLDCPQLAAAEPGCSNLAGVIRDVLAMLYDEHVVNGDLGLPCVHQCLTTGEPNKSRPLAAWYSH